MSAALVSLAAIALVAVFAVGAAVLLGVRGRAPFAVAVLVLGAADVVGSAIVLSPIDGVTRPGMLAMHAVLAAVVAVLWARSGRPRPPRLRNPVSGSQLGGLAVASVILAAAVLLVQLYVLAQVAPSNWDSMTYHLSRAAYWLQYQSVGHYPSGTLRQLHSAPNGEILIAWTMLVAGTDRWVEIVQWISLAGLGAAIFSGARLLRFDATAAAFAAAVFVLLPQPLLQSTTTQNDLVVAFFVSATALFAARGLRDHHAGDLVIAGVALGLAIGTKTTTLFALPALGLIALVAWRAHRPPRALLLRGAALAVAGVVAFGSYNYVLNAAHTGDPFGGLSKQVSVTAMERPANNLVRDLWSFADTAGVQVSWLTTLTQRIGRSTLSPIAGNDFPFEVDIVPHEDSSGYGLVGFVILPFVLLFALLAPRAPLAVRAVSLGVIAYLIAFGIRIDENVWVARLMLPAVALAAPLLAVLGRRSWAAGAVLALALMSAVPSVLQNPAKPLVSSEQQNVFAWSRLDQVTFFRKDIAGVFDRLEENLPADAALALVAAEDSWDYPLFGPHRERRVVRIDRPENALEAIARERVAGLLYMDAGPPPAGSPRIELGGGAWLVLPG